MRTLTVTLPPSPASASASILAVLSADSVAVSRQIEVPLALLPDTADAEVVAVVPVGKLSWHRLELPRGTLDKKMFQEGDGARLRSVLEGLLEDRLLDEPQQLHFALAPQAKTGAPVWVAACERAWLKSWLAALEESGRPALRIVPETAPPDAADVAATLHFVGTPEQAQLIYSGAQGVCVLPYGTAALALVAPAGENAPTVWAEPGVAELAQQHFEGHVSLQSSAQRYLAAARSPWDLAQFDCSASRSARTRKRVSGFFANLWQAPRWRAARWATLALVLVNLLGLQIFAWKEQSALDAKRSAMREILASTFAEVRVVVDAPAQMARAVSDLQRQTGTATTSDLEAMLLQYYTMASKLEMPTAIDFTTGELKLKGLDPGAAGAARIATKMQGLGYNARLEGDTLTLQPGGRK